MYVVKGQDTSKMPERDVGLNTGWSKGHVLLLRGEELVRKNLHSKDGCYSA